jgi:hypothetical protein
MRSVKTWIVSELFAQEFLEILQHKDPSKQMQFSDQVNVRLSDRGIFVLAACLDSDKVTLEKLNRLAANVPRIIQNEPAKYD